MRRVAWYLAARFCLAMGRRAAGAWQRNPSGNPGKDDVLWLRFVKWRDRAAKFSARIGGAV